MNQGFRYVQALALAVDPEWRRRPEEERAADGAGFLEAARENAASVTTYSYSMIGLRSEAQILLWRLAPSLDDLEETASVLLKSGLGRWCRVAYSMVGLVRPSRYVKERTPQEEALFTGERSRYLVVYPFVKSTEWYLMSEDDQRRQMSEHIRVGRGYPMIQQLLAYSFGLDDQEFIVAYETDDLPAFQDLVRDLRATEGRKVTIRDTPQLVGIHRPLEEILDLLG